jgi:NADH-quinone oxidoreductase subunit H
MYKSFDEVFLRLADGIYQGAAWLGLPSCCTPILFILLKVLPILILFPLIFALTTWAERKLLGRFQNRMGPNRVGPVGLFQPIADGLKTLTKEDIVPVRADRLVHTLAPVMMVVASFLVITVLPMGRGMIPADLGIGVLFFFAAGAISEVAVFLAGWASRNKYSLLGGIRAIAQMISYEISFVLSVIAVVMVVGSLSTSQIVEAQAFHKLIEDPEGFSGFFQRVVFHFYNNVGGWFIFKPWGFFGFIIFFIASLAELNRAPFDLPEAESEIIAGHHTEYSGFKFALFALAEYIGMIAVNGLAVTLFFGGWNGPHILPSWAWFFLKVFALMFLMIWIRGTFPRVRVDQLMELAWKFLLPMALVNILAAGVWYHFPSRGIGWIMSAIMLVGSYQLLSKMVLSHRMQKRVYRYA